MATSSYPLTSSAWTDCGATPCVLQSLSSQPVLFVLAAAAPTDLAAAAHVLAPSVETSANVALADQRVYARAAFTAANLIVSR